MDSRHLIMEQLPSYYADMQAWNPMTGRDLMDPPSYVGHSPQCAREPCYRSSPGTGSQRVVDLGLASWSPPRANQALFSDSSNSNAHPAPRIHAYAGSSSQPLQNSYPHPQQLTYTSSHPSMTAPKQQILPASGNDPRLSYMSMSTAGYSPCSPPMTTALPLSPPESPLSKKYSLDSSVRAGGLQSCRGESSEVGWNPMYRRMSDDSGYSMFSPILQPTISGMNMTPVVRSDTLQFDESANSRSSNPSDPEVSSPTSSIFHVSNVDPHDWMSGILEDLTNCCSSATSTSTAQVVPMQQSSSCIATPILRSELELSPSFPAKTQRSSSLVYGKREDWSYDIGGGSCVSAGTPKSEISFNAAPSTNATVLYSPVGSVIERSSHTGSVSAESPSRCLHERFSHLDADLVDRRMLGWSPAQLPSKHRRATTLNRSTKRYEAHVEQLRELTSFYRRPLLPESTLQILRERNPTKVEGSPSGLVLRGVGPENGIDICLYPLTIPFRAVVEKLQAKRSTEEMFLHYAADVQDRTFGEMADCAEIHTEAFSHTSRSKSGGVLEAAQECCWYVPWIRFQPEIDCFGSNRFLLGIPVHDHDIVTLRELYALFGSTLELDRDLRAALHINLKMKDAIVESLLHELGGSSVSSADFALSEV